MEILKLVILLKWDKLQKPSEEHNEISLYQRSEEGWCGGGMYCVWGREKGIRSLDWKASNEGKH